VQTTLLGFAIVIILALVTALVGPFFVDWDSYRADFETRATALTGLEFKVAGAIDARLLPTPTLVLHDIRFGRAGESGRVRGKTLSLEFALSSLLRGELKVADARLEGPELAIGLDQSGHLALPVPSVRFAPDAVSIQRLRIVDGRAILTDAASGSRLVLDKLEFNGDLRSLAGPAKGEGSFVVAGQHYPYRFSASRAGDDGSVKVHLTVDPIDRPLTADADLSISIEQGVPHFDGSLAFARPVGRAPEGAQALIIEPWRITSHIKGDSSAAVLDQIEVQYGPDDRPIKLRGDAKLTLGSKLQLDGALSSAQVDLDRILALPEAARHRPMIAAKAVAEYFSGALRLPFPVRLGIAVETLTFAGAPLLRVRGDIRTDGETWDIEALDFRAPGITQVRLGGRFGVTPAGIAFKGPAKIDSNDPRALLAWLSDRSEAQTMAAGALRISGDLALSSAEIAIDGLEAELDRMTVAGRFGYRWSSGDHPARIDAELTAPEIDIDRIQALGKAMFGDVAFDWPREGQLSLKVGRAMIAGVEAKQTDVSVRIDAHGVEVDRFAIADFGNATLSAKGRIDTQAQSPRGAITFDLDARALDGVTALVEKFSPRAAAELRRSAGRVTPVSLRASIAVESAEKNAPGSAAITRFKADGRAGGFRLALQGDASGPGHIVSLSTLKTADVKLRGRLDADDGRTLVELVGLDHFIAAERKPGRLNFSANGPLNGQLSVDGQLVAGPFSLAANGTMRLPESGSPTAMLAVRMANAGIRSLRPGTASRIADVLPATLSGKLALAGDTATLTDVTGSVASTAVTGRMVVAFAPEMRLDGDFALGALDVPAALAVVVGMPAQGAGATGLWPAEPFEIGLLRGVSGQIKIKSARAMLAPRLLARDAQATLRFSDTEVALQDVDAEVAGGRLAGELTVQRRAEGVNARGHLRFAGAKATELLPGDGWLSGRLTLDVSAEGSGRSANALIGSLGGAGSFTLEDGLLTRLDPAVFEALVSAVDAGLPIDAARVRGWLEKSLATRALPISLAEGAIAIVDGQARLNNTIVRSRSVDLAMGGSVNLADATVDARLALAGPSGLGVSSARPELLMTIKGPVTAARRHLDVSTLSGWLALRAVEQQSRKLEVLEGRVRAPGEVSVEALPGPITPVTTVVQPAAVEPKPLVVQPPAAVVVPPPATARAEPEAQLPRARPAPRPPRPKPAEQARPAPPPMNLLQFFAPRT
jgi:uncharacterized protein involved in outer membrane biogenesis